MTSLMASGCRRANRPLPDTGPPAETNPTTAPTDAEPNVAKVGATQWFNYTDGLKVQVTSLKRFRISQHAAGGKPGDVGVIVTVTLQNSSSSTLDTAWPT
jgi:hypothetical protein